MINSNDFDSGIEEQKSGKSNQLIGDVSPENRDRERQSTAARGKACLTSTGASLAELFRLYKRIKKLSIQY